MLHEWHQKRKGGREVFFTIAIRIAMKTSSSTDNNDILETPRQGYHHQRHKDRDNNDEKTMSMISRSSKDYNRTFVIRYWGNPGSSCPTLTLPLSIKRIN